MSEIETNAAPQPIVVPPPAERAKGDLRVEYLPLRELIPYARNSRTHSDAQVRQIAGSIAEFGFANPILIDQANSIVAGHGRALAAELLKIDTVPCIRLGWLTDTQRRAFVLADNRIALNAGWDAEMLRLELADLASVEYNVGLLGFDADELKAYSVRDPWFGGEEQPPENHQPPSDAPPIDGQLHRILLVYEPDEYKTVLERAQAIMQRDAIADMSRLFAKLLESNVSLPS